MTTQSSTSDGLAINLDDLIHIRSIENSRVEFKATWSPYIRPAVNRTICAFANDLLNLNGGYIILGIEEDNGSIILPPRGLDSLNVDDIQRQIRADCSKFEPTYYPVFVPATFENKSILIIWVPGGDNRPYQAPEDVSRSGSARHYYVRVGSESIKAKNDVLRQLMECAAKVPFDDRRHQNAKIEDLSPLLVKNFLYDVRSDLVGSGKTYDDLEIFKNLRIVAPVNAHFVPRNIGLLFYSESPDYYFPSAKIEVVQFGDDSGGDLIEEKVFKGPLNIQIKRTLNYLDSLAGC